MNEDPSAEIQAIRAVHLALRSSVEALGERIGNLERQVFTPPEPPPPCSGRRKEASLPATPRPESRHLDRYKTESSAPSTPPPLPETPASPPPVPSAPRDSVELHIGRVWLVRVGIVILLTGLVFLGNYAYHEFVALLGPGGKLALLYLAAAALGTIGWLVKRSRAEMANYGRVLIGGALAVVYYATYAAHFVEPLRVIANPILGGALLLGLGGGILWLADRLRSQLIAAATVSLSFYATAINPVTEFSLFGNFVLAVLGTVLLLRRQWTSVSFLSLIGSYAAFAFWRWHGTGSLFVVEADTPALFWTAIAFPASYWLVFTTAILLGRERAFSPIAGRRDPHIPVTRSAFLTLNNAGLYALAAPVVAGTHPDAFWLATSGFAIALILLGILHARLMPRERAADGSYLVQGLVLLSAGLLFKFTGHQLALLFALQSATLLGLSRLRHGGLLQIFSGLAAIVASAAALGNLANGASNAALTASAVAAVLIGNAWLFKRQRNTLHPLTLKWGPAGYLALSTLLTLAAAIDLWRGTPLIAALLGLGLAFTASIYLLRLPELTLAGQFLALVAQAVWFRQGDTEHFLPLAIIISGALVLIHWWQRQRALRWTGTESFVLQGLHTVLPVAASLNWVLANFDRSALPPLLATIALGILIHGFLTRAWTLAIGSQVFAVAAAFSIACSMMDDGPWLPVAGGIVVFALQAAAATALGHRAPVGAARFLIHYSRTIRAISVAMAAFAILAYVPGKWITASWALLAFLTLALGFVLRERSYRIWGLLIILAAIARIFCVDVWQLETLYRILSFLILGIVLLALGFLYNRFAEKIRRWL